LSVFIFCAIVLIIISIQCFWKIFHKNTISGSPQDWGVFGDYFGGILNPLLSFISICITIWLTAIINRFSKKNNESQIDAARRITLIQLKHEALKELRNELNIHFDKWGENFSDGKAVDNCSKIALEFKVNYNYLFNFNTLEPNYMDQLNSILYDAAYAIDTTPNDLELITNNHIRAFFCKRKLLADLGRITIE